jgi:hypothetical protein
MKVRFGLIKNNDDEIVAELIDWFEMQSIPIVGELINIEGYDYYVHERSWAIKRKISYCYIRLSLRKNRT